MKLPALDLFSGIGGNALALSSVCRVVAYCDVWDASRAQLQKLMTRGLIDTAPIFEDVIKLKGTDLKTPPVVITAGFPCQDASCSNPKGRGIFGPRTGLFFEIMRLVDELPSVKCIMLENSECILREGRGFDRLLKELLKRRFNVSMGVFGTWEELGCPHERKRWICLATRDGFVMPRPIEIKFRKWSLSKEPCPRVLGGSVDEKYAAIKRCKMLGNSVVPQQITMAVSQLIDAALDSSVTSVCEKGNIRKSNFVVTTKGCKSYDRVRPNEGGRDYNLHVGIFKFKRWATPMHTHWTDGFDPKIHRNAQMLCVQLFNEKSSPVQSDNRHVNPCFVEYMMGFPKDWTS
jgi:site-specific DNA-cytosine methylase